MQIDLPYWYKVLTHFEENNYIENGLTIPFLIGSKKVIEPEGRIATVRDFLTELHNSELRTTIIRCGRIKEFIVGILDYETKKLLPHYENAYKQFGQILVTDGSLDQVDGFDGLVVCMEAAYESKIQSSHFSKENGKWRHYTDLEIRRIKQSVS